MAKYFCKLDENNVVVSATKLEDNIAPDEISGKNYLNSIYKTNDNWKLVERGITVGFFYDSTNNKFIPNQPFPSWTLNQTTFTWEPPIPFPQNGNPHNWDENSRSWISVQPYPSWIFNNTTSIWEAPIAKPQDENNYVWDENSRSWKLVSNS